jgi:hypothetical protein
VHYHSGVGAEGRLFNKLLGGAIGLGLKQIINDCYDFVVTDCTLGDEVYLIGFSRGASAVRALAGLIGASGIQRSADAAMLETAWQHYRSNRRLGLTQKRRGRQRAVIDEYAAAGSAFHDTRTVKCVAVWDTIGSYGIPAGLGLAPLARYFALFALGFHDTSFGDHVEVGLHAVAVDEHRRPFVPTFWTIPRGQKPKGHVGKPGSLVRTAMLAAAIPMRDFLTKPRVDDRTPSGADRSAVKASTRPKISGAVVDSTKGWPIDQAFPHYRRILSPDAIHHGYVRNTANPREEHINERVHWSVIAKRQESKTPLCDPPNLPQHIPADKVVDLTDQERRLLERDT